MNCKTKLLILGILLLLIPRAVAQISPGDLSKAHAGLEGVSNCTKCHSVGSNKVTREKCLSCHKEIQANITAKKGFHASAEVTGKQCTECHNEHHGRNFQLIRLDKKTFNHSKTGFELKGAHARQECKACHKPAFITDPRLKNKPGTMLGLNKQCLSCHEDFHKGRMSANCASCHNFESFKKVSNFDHNTTRFPLLGEHKTVSCDKCHKTQIIDGKPVKQLRGLEFANCNACHKDPHENRFGQDCKQCHTEKSFHTIKGISTFNHDKTGFPLVGAHKTVDCKLCHKGKMTDPIRHNRCSDCHTDYHKGEFAKNGVSPDCKQCHTEKSFSPSTFSVEKHKQTKFPLEGAHQATACNACHQKATGWTFRNIGGSKCVDCHKNVHKGFIPDRFMANENCTVCHTVNSWKKPNFDHSKTGFKLDGAHAQVACAECHYRKNDKGVRVQKFAGLSKDCAACHNNPHVGQFEVNGRTNCTQCHTTESWHKTKYDHNTSRFKLDGAHATVKCDACHKRVTDEKGTYIQYKFKSIECSTCHS